MPRPAMFGANDGIGRPVADVFRHRRAGVRAHAAHVESREVDVAEVEQPLSATPSRRLDGRHGRKRVTLFRAALLVLSAAAVAAAWSHASSSSGTVEPELEVLLRAMAAVKGVLSLLGAGLVYWRLGLPISTRAASTFIACIGLLFVACVSMWQLTHIALAAAIFHLAGVTLLLVAWREGGVAFRFKRDGQTVSSSNGPIASLHR